MAGVSNSFFPFYFTVKQVHEVMSTEQPCDLAYEFGDGLLELTNYPQGFPNSGNTHYCLSGTFEFSIVVNANV